jgi:hypothetical protein
MLHKLPNDDIPSSSAKGSSQIRTTAITILAIRQHEESVASDHLDVARKSSHILLVYILLLVKNFHPIKLTDFLDQIAASHMQAVRFIYVA